MTRKFRPQNGPIRPGVRNRPSGIRTLDTLSKSPVTTVHYEQTSTKLYRAAPLFRSYSSIPYHVVVNGLSQVCHNFAFSGLMVATRGRCAVR